MMTTPGIRCQKKGIAPVAGLWDFDGSCLNSGHMTVSVGVFLWEQKAGGKGIKRGKAVKRFSGPRSQQEQIFARAEEYCQQREA